VSEDSQVDQVDAPPDGPLDVIAAVDGDTVIVELDVRNNDAVRVGDEYMASWDDGDKTLLRVIGFRSAEEYTNTIARRIEAMREGVTGLPATLTARKAYQTKLAIMRIEGELLADGQRLVGLSRTPAVMVPVERVSDDLLERFASVADGNLILGYLRSGRRILPKIARIRQNYAGDRMVILGMPGKGKTQLVRALLAQAMSE
jgi:hypothetical protein